jgi:hypothetical protein
VDEIRNDNNNSYHLLQLTKNTPTIGLTGTPLNNSWKDLRKQLELVTKDTQWQACEEEARVHQLIVDGSSYYIAKLSKPIPVQFETTVVALHYEQPEELVLQAAWSECHLASKQLTGEPKRALENYNTKRRRTTEMEPDPCPLLPDWGKRYEPDVVCQNPNKYCRDKNAPDDLVELVDNFLLDHVQPGSRTNGRVRMGIVQQAPAATSLFYWHL